MLHYIFSPEKLALLSLLEEVKPSPTFPLKIVVKWRRPSRFPAKITLVHAFTTLYWENLVLVVVLVLESKVLLHNKAYSNVLRENGVPVKS